MLILFLFFYKWEQSTMTVYKDRVILDRSVAMFVSFLGLWKHELFGSGLKASITCSTLSWSNNMKVTFCLNGQRSNGSYSPRMSKKNSKMCVPFPMPSAIQVNQCAHFVSMATCKERWAAKELLGFVK